VVDPVNPGPEIPGTSGWSKHIGWSKHWWLRLLMKPVRRTSRSSKLFTFWRESLNFSADPNMASSSGSTSQSNDQHNRRKDRKPSLLLDLFNVQFWSMKKKSNLGRSSLLSRRKPTDNSSKKHGASSGQRERDEACARHLVGFF
jgi:hypothetical protein